MSSVQVEVNLPESHPVRAQDTSYKSMYRKDRDVIWFDEKPGVIPWPARELYNKYSKIPEEEIEKHVIDLRDRAWDTFPYPCIGQFDFLELQLSQRTRLYHRLLNKLAAGAKFVDIACCMGYDLRKLVFDGAPEENLTGVELEQEYIDLGYDLFKDRDTLKVKLLRGNILDPVDAAPWAELGGQYDVANFGMVLHSFTWEQQIYMLEKGLHVLKNEPGTSMIGIACGNINGKVETWMGRPIPNHSPETFKKLMAEFEAKTGTKWEIDAVLDNAISCHDGKRTWLNPDLKRFIFEITRVA